MRQVRTYDSAAVRSPLVDELVQIFRYRDLISLLVSRNIKTRYKRSVLGVAWTMLHPLLMMAVLTVVFSELFSNRTGNYAAYLLSGLIVWTFFTETTTTAMNELTQSGRLLTRVYIPKAIFAVSAVGSGLVNLVLSLGPLFLILVVVGVPLQINMLFLPASILFTAMFALGVGLILSSLAVYFGDIVPLYTVILRAWMYLTPIIYPESIIPERFQILLRLNPMYYLVQLFREPLYEGALPDATSVGVAAAVGFLTLLIGWWIFTRRADEYAYRV